MPGNSLRIRMNHSNLLPLATILLRMISPSKKFGRLYDAVMFLPEKLVLRSRRKKLLSGLSGNILEVGIGTGTNLEFYGPDVRVLGIEPSPHMFAKAEKRKEELPDSERFMLFNFEYGDEEMRDLIAPESLDAIVCTLVLCTIPNPVLAVSSFMKWLIPGGSLLILEHIKSHGNLEIKLQNRLNIHWEKLAEGCQLNRQTDILLKKSGFELFRESYFRLGLPFYEAEFRKPEKKNKTARLNSFAVLF